MAASLIGIQNDSDWAEAQELISRLMSTDEPDELALLNAQALIVADYEAERWPPEAVSPSEIIEYWINQHRMPRADSSEILGTPSRVSEILLGQRGLSLPMIRRLHARCANPANVLIAEMPNELDAA